MDFILIRIVTGKCANKIKKFAPRGYNKGFELWNLRKFKKVRTNRTKKHAIIERLERKEWKLWKCISGAMTDIRRNGDKA
ncbi:MAG TPA: hypothetical protein PLP24_08035 [Acetivibrio thermocellus]|nr:hypothetical protein [Acetivibrio thermocellus]